MPLIAAALALLQAEPTYDLRVRAYVGDRYTYGLETTMEAEGAEGRFTASMKFSERLSKSDARDLFWETRFFDVKGESSGALKGAEGALDGMENLTYTTIQNRRGQIRQIAVSKYRFDEKGSANVVLPPGPVRIGASWDAEIESNNKLWQIVYSLAEIGPLDGRTVARIEGRYKPGQGIEAVTPTTFWVDAKTGKMVRGQAETRVTVGEVSVRLKYDIRLIEKKP